MTTTSPCQSIVGSMLLSQQSPVERQRQERRQPHPGGWPVQVPKNDIDVAAILPEELTARAARRRGRVGVGDDGDAGEDGLTVGERLDERNPFGTQGQSVGSVLDVAAADDP